MDKNTKMDKKNLIIIAVLMLISGLIIYYLYLKPEKFSLAGNYTKKYTSDTSSGSTIVGSSSSTDLEDCATNCDNSSSCNGFVVDKTSGMCNLKDNMNNILMAVTNNSQNSYEDVYTKNSVVATSTTVAGATTSTVAGATSSTVAGATSSTVAGATTSTVAGATSSTQPSITCPPVINNNIPLSIISKIYGIGFNIYPISTNTNDTYLIEHIPVTYNNTLGSMYAISADGLLTIQLRNEKEQKQWWTISKLNVSSIQPDIYIIKPFTDSNNYNYKRALHYEAGKLSLLPYTEPGYPGHQWLFSNKIVTRGIPVLNYNPASMFTTEFDPYSTSSSINSTSIDTQNSNQVTEVMEILKKNIQAYLSQSGTSTGSGTDSIKQMSTSSLGSKATPISINVNFDNNDTQQVSKFDNITGSITNNDVLRLLDKYDNIISPNIQNSLLYTSTDLQTALQSNKSCTPLNLNDYTSKRVSSCNGCKLP